MGESAPKSKVRASLQRVKFSGNGDFVIAQFLATEGEEGGWLKKGMSFSAKGTVLTPTPGDTYILEGTWESNDKWGWTFKIGSYQRDQTLPSSAEGVREYLLRKVKSIGPVTAKAIIDAYGENAIEVLRTQPLRVAEEIKGITPAKADEIASTLLSQQKEIELEIAIRTITQNADLNQRQINAIIKAYGSEAPTVLKQDPYRLIEEVSGIGWRSADAVAKVVGYPVDGEMRVRAGIIYTLDDAGQSQGHLYLGKEELAVLAMRNLGVALETVERGVLAAIEKRDICEFRRNRESPIDVALSASFGQERVIAGVITRFLLTPEPEGMSHQDILADLWLSDVDALAELWIEDVGGNVTKQELEAGEVEEGEEEEDEDEEFCEDDDPEGFFDWVEEKEARALDDDEEYWAARDESDEIAAEEAEVRDIFDEQQHQRDIDSVERDNWRRYHRIAGHEQEADSTWALEVMLYDVDDKRWID